MLLYFIVLWTGVPDAPNILLVRQDGSSFKTSWSYDIIPTVSVTFNLSLTFFNTSKLKDKTAEIINTESHNFTLEDVVGSCDQFKLCIRARNTVGVGKASCMYGISPYLPPNNMILYSLTRNNTTFTVSVNITVRYLLWYQ